MKKIFWIIPLLLSAWVVEAQPTKHITIQQSLSAVGAGETFQYGGSYVGVGLRYHAISCQIFDGTVSASSLDLEGSNDRTTWTDIIAGLDCTTATSSAVTAGYARYLRLKLNTFTVSTGTPRLDVFYAGYWDNPVTSVGVEQGSTTSGQVGQLVQGAVSTAAPTYVNGKTNPISIDTSGNVRATVPSLTDGTQKTQIVDSGGTVITSFGSSVDQASTTTGQSGPLIQGAVSTGAPSYATGKTNPLSLATDGSLRAAITNLPTADTSVHAAPTEAPIGIGGLYTLAQSTAVDDGDRTAIQTDSYGNLLVVGKGAAGTAAGGVLTVQGVTSMTPVQVQSGSQYLTYAQASTTSGQYGPLSQAAVVTTQPTYTTAQTSALSQGTTGHLRATDRETYPATNYATKASNGATDVALLAADANNSYLLESVVITNSSASGGWLVKICDGACSTANFVQIAVPIAAASSFTEAHIGHLMMSGTKNTAVNFACTTDCSTTVQVSATYRKVPRP